MQLREYIDDTEDYINIQVGNVESNAEVCFLVYVFFRTLTLCILFLQLDNHRNQLIQVLYDFLFTSRCPPDCRAQSYRPWWAHTVHTRLTGTAIKSLDLQETGYLYAPSTHAASSSPLFDSQK